MADRYQVVRKVAQGGFGEVYTAFDRMLKREVAIKRLLSKNDGAEEEAAEAAFQREALVLAAMQHPNIVNIFDFDRDEEGTFVVMEMLEGKTLKEALDRGALTWDDFNRLVRQSLDAMVAAHKADILHRDLKPENIFLKRTVTGSWTVKVLDFGLAKLSQQPSRQTMDGKGNVFGSIYYMAPEQFRREPLDVRTDLYALGCVYYQALTQRFPFEGENMSGTMDAHLTHQVKPVDQRRKDTPSAVAAWLMRMISQDRNDRPPSAMAARKEFEDALDGKAPVPAGMVALPPSVTGSTTSSSAPPPAPVARPPMTTAPGRAPAYANGGAHPSGGTAVATAPAPPRSAPQQRSNPSPARATSGVVTVNPRPVMSTSTVTSSGEAVPIWKKHQNLLLAGVPVLLAVGFFVFLSGRSQDGNGAAVAKNSSTAKPSTSGTSTSTSSTSSGSKPPVNWPSSLPKAIEVTLPLEEQLTWRFRADTEIWYKGMSGNDERKPPPSQGARIHVWKSMAPNLKEIWLRGYDSVTEHFPAVTVGDVNGPGTTRTRISFANQAGLRHMLDSAAGLRVPGNGVAGSKGVTLAAVFRANASKKDKSIRPVLLSSSWSKDTFSLHHSHVAGQYWARLQHGEALVLPLVRPTQFEKKGSPWMWAAVVAVWDSAAGKVRVAVRSPDGKITHSDDASVPTGMPMMDQLTLGYYPLPSDSKLEKDEKFDGDLVETAVYQHALDRSNQEKVLNALWDCYFLQR